MTRWIAHFMTAGNLLCGIAAIVAAADGSLVLAGWLIILAAALDAFDGKAARYFGGGSEFGLHFDSFADMTSFGVASGFLAFFAGLEQFDIVGLILIFIPAACAAIRLARFNIKAADKPKQYTGLSSPLHGCLIASFVITAHATWGEVPDPHVLAGILLLSSALMVSPFPMPKLPRLSVRITGFNILKLVILGAVLILAAIHPARHAFPAIAFVIVAGFIGGVWQVRHEREDSDSDEDLDQLDDSDHQTANAWRGHQ